MVRSEIGGILGRFILDYIWALGGKVRQAITVQGGGVGFSPLDP
jgi:hypothetical protein